jgi:hypothetical protein
MPQRDVENASIAAPITVLFKRKWVSGIVVSYPVQIIVRVAGRVLRSHSWFFEEAAMRHKMTGGSLAARQAGVV